MVSSTQMFYILNYKLTPEDLNNLSFVAKDLQVKLAKDEKQILKL